MRVSDLRKETKKLSIIYKGMDNEYPVEVEYRWRTFPFNFWAEHGNKPQWKRDIEQIKETIVSWNLEDENGKPIPIEDDALLKAQIPRWLLDSIFAEIERDQFRDGEEKKD